MAKNLSAIPKIETFAIFRCWPCFCIKVQNLKEICKIVNALPSNSQKTYFQCGSCPPFWILKSFERYYIGLLFETRICTKFHQNSLIFNVMKRRPYAMLNFLNTGNICFMFAINRILVQIFRVRKTALPSSTPYVWGRHWAGSTSRVTYPHSSSRPNALAWK